MKKITKALVAVALLVMLSVCMFGCEKTDLVGRWTLSAVDAGGEDGIEYMLMMGVNPTDLWIELRSDGTYTRTLVGGEQTGTYEKTEKGLLFTYSDGADEFTLNGNTLSYHEDDTTVTFTKDK